MQRRWSKILSKPSSHTFEDRTARICRALILAILVGYAGFSIFALADKMDFFGRAEPLPFFGVALSLGLVPIVGSALVFLSGLAGIISNIAKKTQSHLKTFFVSMLIPLLIIPFNIVFISLYGF